jgi:hypothetical protein
MRFYVLLLMAFLLTPTLSYAKCDTVIDCYQQSISDLQDARAEIDKLRQQAEKDAETIENLRQSAKTTNRQIKRLLTQLNTTAEQVAKLTEAVSVSEDGKVGIGTTNPKEYEAIQLQNHKHSTIEMRAYGDDSPIWTSAGILTTWNTDVDLGIIADSATNIANGKSNHVLWMKADSGNVGIGTTNPEGPLHVKTPHRRIAFSDGIGFSKGGGNDYQLQINAVGGIPHIDLANSANEDFDIRLAVYHDNQLKIQGGNVYVDSKLQARELVQKSDQRHKQNIHTLGGSLAKIAQLRGVHFNWKDNPEDQQIGLVAQEVEKVFPELVSTDSEGYKSIAYGKLTAVLLEAVKEQQLQIDSMAQQIRALSE